MGLNIKRILLTTFSIGFLNSMIFTQEITSVNDSLVLGFGGNIDRIVINNSFKKGEFLKFDIRYGPVKAGFAYMEIPDIVQINGRPTYHVISRAESNNFFSSFYKVRDRVESFIDSVGIFPWRFEKHLREGSFSADVFNVFDHLNQYVITRKDTFQVPLYVQDVLSALYFVRTQNLQVEEHLSVDNFSDGKNFPLEVKILKKEKIRVKAGRFSCFVVEPILKSTGIFKQKGSLKVWMTEDETHTPVMMKSEIVVGAIIVELIEYRGVNPVKL